MTAGVARKTAVGVAWMTSARAAVRVLGFMSTLLLARLLAPADFGIVAMAMVVASALELLTMFNFDVALVQAQRITRAHYDSAWTLNLLMGVVLGLLLVAVAAPAAAFYREPRLQAVMELIALKYVIDSAGNPGTTEFRRALDFRPDFLMQVTPKIAGVVVTACMAFWLGDYRALLAGMLLTSAASCAMSYRLHPHRPRWCLAEAGPLFRFSRWLLLNNLVSFLRTRTAELIVGRLLGPTPLGIFTVASEVANLPTTEMVAPINRVLFPSYVHLAGDAERLRRAFRAALGMITLVILPVCAGLAALSEPLVRVMLGPKWLEAAPLIAVLSIGGAALVLQATTGSIYNALGKPRLIALTGGLHAASIIPMLLVGTSKAGLTGTAWAVLLHSVGVGLFLTYAIFLRTTPIRVGDVLSVSWRPLVACTAMYGVLRTLLGIWGPIDGIGPSSLALFTGCAVGAATYLLCILALWFTAGRPEAAETLVIDQVRDKLLRRRERP